MSSFLRSNRVPVGTAAILAVSLLIGCSGAKAASVTPTALANAPSTYDTQSVSVSGTVKNPRTRKTRRGTAVMYQLCDSACINVFQFGDNAAVTDGSTASVTGMFHASFGRVHQINNVVVVGGRPGGWRGGGSGAPTGAASPAS